jgi:hypothetical protein
MVRGGGGGGGSKKKELSKLLFCACRDRCQDKTAPQSTTHKCPGCQVPIHAKCGFPDGDDTNIRWCYHCKYGRTPSPSQRITRRQAVSKKTVSPKNIFEEEVLAPALAGEKNIGNASVSTLSVVDQGISVAQLPKCACRDRCGFPNLPRATGHHCPGCKLAIHAVCGIYDEKAGLDDSNWCHDCWESRMQKKMPPRKTSPAVQQQQKKKGASSSKKADVLVVNKGGRKIGGEKPKTNLQTESTIPRKQPRKSTTTRATSKGRLPETNVPPQRKTSSTRAKNLKNKIILPREATTADPFVRMKVAFHLDGPERPDWLVSRDYVPYGKDVGSRLYLFGIILRRDKVTKTACTYRVEWEHSALGESVIDINVLQPAMDLARKLQCLLDEESKHPLGVDVLHFLRANDGSAPGAAIPSDDEENSKASDAEDDQDDDDEQEKDDDM